MDVCQVLDEVLSLIIENNILKFIMVLGLGEILKVYLHRIVAILRHLLICGFLYISLASFIIKDKMYGERKRFRSLI